MSNDKIQEIKDVVMRMELMLQRLEDKQMETLEDVRKIKDAIYNPEDGLYARVKDLEQWQSSVSKVLWSGALSILALITKTFYDLI
jgi:L-ribulose-5-phosphate 3-epimerase UlaE